MLEFIIEKYRTNSATNDCKGNHETLDYDQ